MSKLTTKIKDVLRGSRALAAITSEKFPPMDKVKLKRTLKIEEAAASDGANNLPPSDSKEFAPTEKGIKAELLQHRNEYSNDYSGYLQVYKNQYEENRNDLNIDFIRNEEETRMAEAYEESTMMQGDLEKMSDQLKTSAKELLKFREMHQLLHRTPDTKDVFKMMFLVLSAFVAEVIVTIFLTREAGSLTTVSTIVVLYCILNFAAPFFFARQVKYMFYNPIDMYYGFKKAFGCLFGLALLIGLLFLNLGMGHYRSAGLTFSVSDAETIAGIIANFTRQQELMLVAWQNFIDNPFGIDEILSWMLVLLGYFLSFYALYEGVVWEDKYPGYGRLAKRYNDCHEEYQYLIEGMIVRIDNIREKAIVDVNMAKQRFNRALATIPDIEVRAESIHEAYIQACKKLSQDHEELVTLYRHVNKQHRTDPPPQYFDRVQSLEVPDVEKYSPERIDLEVDKEKVFGHIDNIARSLHERIGGLAESVPSADKVISEIGYPLAIR